MSERMKPGFRTTTMRLPCPQVEALEYIAQRKELRLGDVMREAMACYMEKEAEEDADIEAALKLIAHKEYYFEIHSNVDEIRQWLGNKAAEGLGGPDDDPPLAGVRR